jgi:predicted ester cyclase
MGADSDVITRLANEVFMGGDFSGWDDLIDDGFVDHDPMPGMADDKKGQRDVAEMVVSAFSNRKMSMHDVAETGDGRVVENWRMEGTHTGEAMGIPPSNKDISVRGMELWRVANGKVVEHWGVVDISDVLEKAGLIPPS